MSAPIVVAHVVNSLKIGGLERMVATLTCSLPSQRYRCVVICLQEGGEFTEPLLQQNLPIIVLGKRNGIDLPLLWRLASILRDQRVTILHTHNLAPHFYGICAAIIARTPIRVHTKHGQNYWGRNPYLEPGKLIRNRILSWFTNAIIPVSDNAQDVVLRTERVKPEKVRRIWNGVDVGLYKHKISNQRSVVGGPMIGTVARLSPEKDQMTMLTAFKIVLDEWKRISDDTSLQLPHLVMVGDGPCMAGLRNTVNRLGIVGQVDFLGMRSDVSALLANFDIFTLTSTTEGISMTILEAMACGVPVVATDVGGNREIVQTPTCGLIVPARDPEALAKAYLELLHDPLRRSQMGAAGRQRVIQNFSVEIMTKNYACLYDELLDRKSA